MTDDKSLDRRAEDKAPGQKRTLPCPGSADGTHDIRHRHGSDFYCSRQDCDVDLHTTYGGVVL